jgi:tetratricopeptide (TPR) repeat protein
MKNQLFILLLLCTASLVAQPINNEVNADGKSPKLLGKINQEGLSNNSYASWFLKNHSAYEPNSEIISQIKDELSEYTIELFMGTWCGDSKREVPRFYKVLEVSGFPMERLTAVAVDRDSAFYKQSPGGEQEGKNIHRVPTLIFYKNGVEVNRITESPVTTLEADIAEIIAGDYIPNYFGVSMVNDLLEQVALEKFNKKSRKLQPELKAEISNRYELNTYARILFGTGRKEQAIAVYRLNTLLFPDEVGTYLSLANTLGVMGDHDEAIATYKKALAVDPENKEAAQSLEYIKSKI